MKKINQIYCITVFLILCEVAFIIVSYKYLKLFGDFSVLEVFISCIVGFSFGLTTNFVRKGLELTSTINNSSFIKFINYISLFIFGLLLVFRHVLFIHILYTAFTGFLLSISFLIIKYRKLIYKND